MTSDRRVPSLADEDEDGSEGTAAKGHNPSADEAERPCLVVIGGEFRGRMFEVRAPEVLIGRAADAAIRVREWGVSRLHARILHRGQDIFIEDLDSSNGTFVNTYRIVEAKQLRDGDKIRVGRTIFMFTYAAEIEDQSYKRFSMDEPGSSRVLPQLDDGDGWRVPCAVYRGGTSKALFFLEEDLPRDPETRDRIVLAAFGSPDPRQIDGLGGADPLTSKVGYIGPSSIAEADVDYTFGYVGIVDPIIDYAGSCGNTAAAVGPFALLRGLVKATGSMTRVRIHNTNTGKIIVTEFPTRDGKFVSEGTFQIDGVPGTGSKIRLDFVGSGGSVTGLLLPTGKPRDEINFPGVGTLTVSFVDAANPFVFVRGADLGLVGDETIEAISANQVLLQKCEIIRGIAAEIMGIASRDVATEKSPGVPKVALVSEAMTYDTRKSRRASDPRPRTVSESEIDIIGRMTALQKLHKTFAVTGAVCLGAAAQIEGSIVNELFRRKQPKPTSLVRIGHPSGTIEVEIEVMQSPGTVTELRTATVFRTARLLMNGDLYVPYASRR